MERVATRCLPTNDAIPSLIEQQEFIGVINLAAVTATTCTYIFIFAVTYDMEYLYVMVQFLSLLETDESSRFTDFSGFMAAIVAFAVAHKQAYPQRSLQLPGFKFESRVSVSTTAAICSVASFSHRLFLALVPPIADNYPAAGALPPQSNKLSPCPPWQLWLPGWLHLPTPLPNP